MPTSEVLYLGDLRTQCTHLQSGTVIYTDAPVDNEGKGEMFSPTDIAATSLACCMMTIMGIFARRSGFSIDGTRAEVTKIMGTDPRRISEIKIDLYFPENNYSEKERSMIDYAVKNCPVELSLHPDIIRNVVCHFN
jgi:putative redox protein